MESNNANTQNIVDIDVRTITEPCVPAEQRKPLRP